METFFLTILKGLAAFVATVTLFLGFGGTPPTDPVATLAPLVISETIGEGIKSEAAEETKSTEATDTETRASEDTAEVPGSITASAGLLPQSEPISQTVIEEVLNRIRVPKHEVQLSVPETNDIARKAVVNIFCISKSGGLFEPLSGSGVIIDPRGIILTNAHVGQYFLLRDYLDIKDFIDCIIRTGSPAHVAYRAELVFLSPAWVENNAKKLSEEDQRGTGKDDYAFLRITETIPKEDGVPSSFTTLSPKEKSDRDLKNLPVLVASYPAGFLGGTSINRDLWAASSVTDIVGIYTFRETEPYTPDIFGMTGTVGTQEGSSGGAVVSLEDGSLVGLITARTEGKTTGERELRAITISHINESLYAYMGLTFEAFLKKDLRDIQRIFEENDAPRLKKLLEESLDKQ
ncbi:MAG: trypsin-like peptidase domain-containing protein [Parcubacteria group bacterium]|nr:trypsin-like peptidase domain-containing protein [Parcubacteria group bacterium]